MNHRERLFEINNIPVLNYKVLNYLFENNLVPQDDDLWLEFGTYDGRSINKISRYTEKTIYGFDSFEGLPEPWVGRIDENGEFHHHKGVFDLGGGHDNFTLDRFFVYPNVKLIKGWFKDTLPVFMEENDRPISFIHVDCDIYSSTVDVFKYTHKNIKNGCIIVFDEMIGYPNFEEHEWKAWWEFVENKNITFEWIGGNVGGVEIPNNINKKFGEGTPHFHEMVSPSYENVGLKILHNPTYKF
jgi:hypothetical protein